MKSLPAFPIEADLAGSLTIPQMRGMTLRDYFAAKAMEAEIIGSEGITRRDTEAFCLGTAEVAYQMADAMMKVREQ